MKRNALILIMVLVFLALFAGLWQFCRPLRFLNRVSLYNSVFPGRDRLPFGESPQTAYNFSIGSLDAAFASHRISGAGKKDPETLRVIMIGDSSSWGTLLRPSETLCGQLDGRALADGRLVSCFNLAYPTLSLTKDLMLLNRAMDYDPDLVIWPLTMESFPRDKQTDNALVRSNPGDLAALFPESGLPEDQERSLWSQRREIADWYRLQLYGLMWAGTGIDQDYPEKFPAPQTDLDADNTFHGTEGPLPDELLAWDVLEAGIRRAGEVPVLIINEPMLISSGENSEIRYNYYYPREAYDSWNKTLAALAEENNWNFADLHDVLDTGSFTNSAIHYDAESASLLADLTIEQIELILLNGPS